MIRDKFFLWPYETDSLEQASAEMLAVLAKTDLRRYCLPEGGQALKTGGLHEFMALECRTWNVNPWWLIVCAQREQSAMSGQALSLPAVLAWLGVTGTNERTSRPGFFGVYPQVSRCCEITAWLLGVEPAEKWPQYWRTRKQAPRWKPGVTVDRYGTAVRPLFAGDYMQLSYTLGKPTDTAESILKTNEALMRQLVPAKYW